MQVLVLAASDRRKEIRDVRRKRILFGLLRSYEFCGIPFENPVSLSHDGHPAVTAIEKIAVFFSVVDRVLLF
jgi:hypothetical protein